MFSETSCLDEKRKSILWLVLLFLLSLGLTGCMASKKRREVLHEIGSRDVKPAIYAKVEKKQHLDLDDIAQLVDGGVPDKIIILYLQQTYAVYSLKTQDIDRLRKANISESLIDYLLATPTEQYVEHSYRYSYYRPYGPYYYGHGYRYHGHGHHHHGAHH